MSNILLKSVCKAMERIAPLRLAEKWDNVRLESLVLFHNAQTKFPDL